jgi:pimeloyl-ACP methyl ester carboxylesterase
VRLSTKARYRDPALGNCRELDLPQGRLRCFDAGTGPPIVFVHGLFVNANVWRKLVPRLAPDFHCLTLDLPFGSHVVPMDLDAGDNRSVPLEDVEGPADRSATARLTGRRLASAPPC